MSTALIDHSSALFLDFDGTLIEIAETPDAVIVPPELPGLLTRLSCALGGGLAIVSGRPLPDIDKLLAPFAVIGAGEHGAYLRFAHGAKLEIPSRVSVPEKWRLDLMTAASHWPGVLVENKPHGVTIHYRLSPEREPAVLAFLQTLIPADHPAFRLIPARMAIEIGARGTSKGTAVESFMRRAPFKGRRPFFVGDDFTDEAGMEVARQFGGVGLQVAESFEGQPKLVRAWLQETCERLELAGGRAA
jgi:trehalose 6-phosphate phosphatase